MKDYWQNYIDGKFVDGGAGVIQVDNPGTGEKLADQAIADNADVDKAVSAAKKVHESGFLTNMRPVERARMVKKNRCLFNRKFRRNCSIIVYGSR